MPNNSAIKAHCLAFFHNINDRVVENNTYNHSNKRKKNISLQHYKAKYLLVITPQQFLLPSP
jgi:hypothetical protein